MIAVVVSAIATTGICTPALLFSGAAWKKKLLGAHHAAAHQRVGAEALQ